MASLKSLCRTVDRQVADIERETRTAVIATKGPYASNAADQLRDEAAALKNEIENSLMTVKEDKNNMTSFLEEMKVQFGEIVADTLKMEDFMGQYGFKSKTPVVLEDILNWDAPEEATTTPAAAAEFAGEILLQDEVVNTSVHETDTVISIPPFKPKPKTPPVQQKPKAADSPNFFDVGLSNLAMELVTGKSVRSNQPRPKESKNVQDELRLDPPAAGLQATKVQPKPQPVAASAYIQDDSMYAASPVLRLSSKLIKPNDLSNMSNMSNVSNMSALDNVDITPGLPSRKKPFAQPAKLPELTVNDDDTPVMPELQTVNFASFNWQQSSSASPNLPTVKLQSKPASKPSTPDLPRATLPTSDTPELPDLQTMDIRKLVQDSKLVRRITPTEPSLLTRNLMVKVGRENTPEEPQLTGHYNQYKNHPTDMPSESNNTPEEPTLTGQYNKYQPHLANAFPLPKRNTPELPELSILQDRQDRGVARASKSPETPVLSYNFRN